MNISEMSNFDWLTILAVFSWIPSMYPLIKGKFARSNTDIIPSKFIQIGFNKSGPTINLNVVFSVKNIDHTINFLKVLLKHKKILTNAK